MVAFTSNIGLAKPTNSEVAKNWIELAQYQDDNNVIITNKTNVVLTNYTPVLTAATTPPNIGAGAIRGEYCEVQGFIFGNFVIEFLDPGVAGGTGEIAISLPAVVDNTYHAVSTAFAATPAGAFSIIGEGYVFDGSNINNSGSIALEATTVSGVSYARLVNEAFTGKTSNYFLSGQPFVPATTDRFSGQFFYKKL